MKKFSLILLLALASPLLAIAPGPSTLQAESVRYVTLTFNVPTTQVVLTMFYQHQLTLNAGGAVIHSFPSIPETVSVDFIAQAGNTVCTVASIPYTGAQVQAILTAVAVQARAAQGGPF